MGRTNGIILALGLLACIALTVMMQHLAGVADRSQPAEALASRIDAEFGSALVAESAYAEDDLAGHRIGVLTIYPAPEAQPDALAGAMGGAVWRRRGSSGQLMAVVVDTVSATGERQRFQVSSPEKVGDPGTSRPIPGPETRQAPPPPPPTTR